jgi:3-methyladenine DNA glycosylase AlkC
MPSSDAPMPSQLKDWFNEDRHHLIAREMRSITTSFRAESFLERTLEGLEERTLMQRLHQCAIGVDVALPGSYRQKVSILKKLAPRLGHEFVAIFLCDFVATFGRSDPDFSMEALRYLTRFGSAEFAVRGFIDADPERALATMLAWTRDPDEKVRRLASEGARPRLPWGMRLRELVRDPEPCAAILEALKDDESLFVRRSVANHLNDIAKDHPKWVLARLAGWDMNNEKHRWIARHACRTLIKRGDPGALKLLGFGNKADVEVVLAVSPRHLRLGDRLKLEAKIRSRSSRAQRLAIDYVIHYVKARGAAFEKVFKWTVIDLPAGQSVVLTKSQVIQDFTTRKHHRGHHVVEVQVNGQRVAKAGFDLEA